MNVDESDATAEAERSRYADALSHTVRRRVVRVLEETGTTLSLTELAVELPDESGTADPESDRVRRRKLQLYHRHLPKLSAVGLVKYDADRRTAAIAEGFARGDVPESVLAA